ncbi:MAG: tetratricopeptide repeat protein [Flavobacteriaceae bacterium]|nr:tetratricopeptide repeat protein [Flavobacteriaceae bacterium]
MRKQILALALGLTMIGAFAQKRELRDAEKSLKKGDFNSAMSTLNSVKGMFADMDDKYKAQYYFLQGQTLTGKNDIEGAADAFNKLFDFEKEIGKQWYSDEAKPMLNELVKKVSQRGANLYNKDKDYKNAAKDFYLTYKLSPIDTSYLYNAAVSASLAKDYDTALEYYKELQKIGYTGIEKQYFAVNKETGEKENMGNLNNQQTYIRLKTHINPTVETSESRQADIIKNIGYIYINQGKTKEAIEAIKEARKSNPKDLNLLLNEAQLYIDLGQNDKFGELMKEAIALDPNNPTLFFNLGVVNQNQEKLEEAVGYYKRAIELKPDYGDAYMNLAIALLVGEQAIVDEMNKNLADEKKYRELEAKQKALYKEALPYLEKADEIKRSQETVNTLINIYDVLLMEDKASKMREIKKKM